MLPPENKEWNEQPAVTNWITDLTFIRALTAGAVSFISPCVVPLIPAFASLVIAAGSSKGKGLPLLNSLVFLAGFLSIFVLTGTSLGVRLAAIQGLLRITGAILTILWGLYALIFAGFPLLRGRAAGSFMPGKGGASAVLLTGCGFASGWTPCIGPTLGTIFVDASTQGTAIQGFLLLITYAAGLAAPFLFLAFILQAALRMMESYQFARGLTLIFSGSLLLLMGTILLSDNLRQLTPLFPDLISY